MNRKKIKSEDAPAYTTPAMTDDQILDAAQAIAKRRLENNEPMLNPAATRRYLTAFLRNDDVEQFGCLWLDSQHKLLMNHILFMGTIDGASVYPREVLKAAIAHKAAAVVFYHNHPSGEPAPSMADKQITRRLQEALTLIDVRVLDHIVVGAADTVSFAERGLL